MALIGFIFAKISTEILHVQIGLGERAREQMLRYLLIWFVRVDIHGRPRYPCHPKQKIETIPVSSEKDMYKVPS